ncbi:MAG: type II secretion system protein GspM [Candidatus Berkiella sp.]
MQLNDVYQKTTEIWEKVEFFVNARSQRERTLLLITGGALVVSMIYSFFIAPINEEIANIQEEKNSLMQQYDATHNQLVALQGAANKGGLVKSTTELQLEELLAKKNESLAKFKNKIIPPTRIPYLLESMLRDLNNLKLVSMETIERVPFNPNKESNDSSALYKHRVKITFTGEYLNMLRYLKRVEKLPFPIGWESLEYKITQFPQARIVLTIYMLSSPLEATQMNTGLKNDKETEVR